jgi:HK97 family phage major capsid protein
MTDRPDKPGLFYREMRLEVMPLDPAQRRADGEAADPRIPVALSSETPVERYDWMRDERYVEVLSHEKADVNLEYARDGLPFLLDHSTRVQIGLLEDVRVDSDRRIRGLLRQGNHPDAEWAFTDIRAGIRKKVSVGYDPGETYDQTENDRGQKVRRYRGWMPMEGSSVAVPADYEVGIGRSAAPGAQPSAVTSPAAATAAHKERTMSDQDEKAAAAAQAADLKVKIEENETLKRDQRKLLQYTKDFPSEAPNLFAGWIERQVTPEQALGEIEAAKREKARDPIPVAGHLDFSNTDRERYNLAGAILEIADGMTRGRAPKTSDPGVGLVFEADAAIRARLDRQGPEGRKVGSGLLVPMDMKVDLAAAQRGQMIAQAFGARASITGNIVGTSSLGGAGVQTSLVDFIDLLRARSRTAQLGVQFLTGLTDTIGFVRQLTANTFTWPGENPSSELTLTAATISVFTMAPKIGMAGTAYSRSMLAQRNSAFDVTSFVVNDLNTITAIGIDTAVHSGGGTLEPTGIRGTTNVQTVTVGAAGGPLTWDLLVDFGNKIEIGNADIGTIGWLTNPKVKGKLKKTLKNTATGSAYLWETTANPFGPPVDTLDGYNAVVSTTMPSNLTKGTSTTVCSSVLMGVWNMAMLGEWGGVAELVVNPFTYLKQNVIEVVNVIGIDVGVRQPTAFCKDDDVTTT